MIDLMVEAFDLGLACGIMLLYCWRGRASPRQLGDPSSVHCGKEGEKSRVVMTWSDQGIWPVAFWCRSQWFAV